MPAPDGPILRLGVIGLGRASTSMLPSLAAHPCVRLVAGCDLRPEATEAFAAKYGAQTCASADELCRLPDVDAVYIATPHQWHAPHVLLAAQHGKHAIVEKPLALTLADCDRMIEAVAQAGTHLVVGHTHSFDPPVLAMRAIIASGALGRLRMINTWDFTDFLYRPRRPEELDTALGGGIIFNQVPHQVDTVRLLGGGLLRSVRSSAGVWDPARPTEGSHATFLQFQDGAIATVVYSGYDHFNSDELFEWVAEGGRPAQPGTHGAARRALRQVGSPEQEAQMKASTGVGGTQERYREGTGAPRNHPHFGVTVVSCERGDLRPTPRGVDVFSEEGRREVVVPLGRATPDKGRVIDELYEAVVTGQPTRHDGRWGKATLEACLAILESSRTQREITLTHQVPWPDPPPARSP
jgi:phthalate 4,5-cis-dihydrodiol dehydrogenase